jgi:hypothetical protein
MKQDAEIIMNDVYRVIRKEVTPATKLEIQNKTTTTQPVTYMKSEHCTLQLLAAFSLIFEGEKMKMAG